MAAIAQDHPVKAPGTQFNYSDVNFIALGEIVHRVSHMPLNVFCKTRGLRAPGHEGHVVFAVAGAETPHRAHRLPGERAALGRGVRPHFVSHGRGGRSCRGLFHGRRPGPPGPDARQWRRESGPTYSQPRDGRGHDQSRSASRASPRSAASAGTSGRLTAGSSTPRSRKVPSGTPAIPAPPCGSIPARRRL